MKKLIARVLFIIAFIIRNGRLPQGFYTDAVVETTWREPLRNMPGNAWRWAEPVEIGPESNELPFCWNCYDADMPSWVYDAVSDDDYIF